jgi:glyoxylase-like metal-dependent hydrolase (beta-lactamase superfamily II)
MIIETLVVGPLLVNCYLAGCERTREAVVIDPGDDADKILAAIQRHKLKLKHIINTHAHFDHLGAVQTLREATGAPFRLHPADVQLVNSYLVQAAYFGLPPGPRPQVDGYLNDGDEIVFGDEKLRVLHTPGHSPGGVSFAGNGVVFVGDELFLDSIGRTDFPGGNYEVLINAIRTKLFPLGDDVVVYPGHGSKTTIGRERLHNPFFE